MSGFLMFVCLFLDRVYSATQVNLYLSVLRQLSVLITGVNQRSSLLSVNDYFILEKKSNAQKPLKRP